MPLILGEVTKEKKRINMTFHGAAFWVDYRVNVVTPGFVSRTIGLKGDEAIFQLLDEVVDAWEILDDNKQQLKPCRDIYHQLPNELMTNILDAILADMKPRGLDGAEKKDSGGG